MKRLVAYIFIAVFISYLPTTPVFAQDKTEQVAASDKNQVTVLYKDGLLDMDCSAVPLGKVLKVIGDNTSTNFILTDPAIEKTPVTLSLQQVSIDNALKRILRGYSYSSSFENDVETVTVFPSQTGKNASRQPAISAMQASVKQDIPIRPDTYIAPGTTIEVDDVIRPDDYVDPDTVAETDDTLEPDNGEIKEAETEEKPLDTEEGLTDTNAENEVKDALISLDDFMPIELQQFEPVAYNEEEGETGNNAEQYRQRVAAEQEMRLKRSIDVLASNHTNLYNDALNEVVGIDSPQATAALLQTATVENEQLDTTTKIVAAEGLWHHAADFGFSDPSSVAALRQMAQDNDPAVRRIGQQALRDMERYRARQR